MSIPPNTNFIIIGLGLMGGSYALGLSRAGYPVTALDTNPDSLAWALEHGLIQQGAAPGTPEAALLLGKADCVVLALYPADIVPWLHQHKSLLKPAALVTDLAGVKGCFVDEAQALLAPQHEFIPCHPMAGREVSGVQNANTAMFTKANFIITPTKHNTPKAIAFAEALANTLGFARITQLSVQEHDAMIGYVSQLTHAIALSLMNANDDPRLPDVTGDSFRDLTRIADMNDALWSELFLANAPALLQEIDDFTACLQTLRSRLASGDAQGLRQLMQQSTKRRREFNAH